MRDEIKPKYLIMDWRNPRNKKWIRLIALFVVIAFLNQDLVWAQGGTPVWPRAQNGNGSAKSAAVKTDILIPNDIAVTGDAYKSKDGKTIINIQDAHASLGAQESIVSILDSLVSNYDLQLIGIEGSAGYIDTSLLKTFPDENIKRKTAERLMKEGRMSAGEFFSITSNKNIALYGIEDRPLYRENIGQFRRIYELNQRVRKDTAGLVRALKALRDAAYPEDLKSLEDNAALHRDGKIGFSARWQAASTLASGSGADYRRYVNLVKLAESLKLEKAISFKRANEERDGLVDALSKKLPKEDLEQLVLRSVSFKAGKMQQGEYYVFLQGLAQKSGIESSPYGNLIRYTDYVTLYESIDIFAVFEEMKAFEDSIKEKLFTDDCQRKLEKALRCAEFMQALFEIKLANGEVEYLQKNIATVSAASMASLIREASAKYDITIDADYDLGSIFEAVPAALEFYKTADKRNQTMLANTIKRMDEEGANLAALITGGYHTKGMSELLRQKGTSYLVILPKFDSSKGERPYVAILTNKKAPYEGLLESGRYYLAAGAYFDDDPTLPEGSRFAKYEDVFAGAVADAVSGIKEAKAAYEKAEGLVGIWLSNYESFYRNFTQEQASGKAPTDFTPRKPADVKAALTDKILEKLRRPFDLKKAPAARAEPKTSEPVIAEQQQKAASDIGRTPNLPQPTEAAPSPEDEFGSPEALPQPPHAYRPMASGGLNWALILGSGLVLTGYYALSRWETFSASAIVIISCIAALTFIMTLTSVIRVVASCIAIYRAEKARPENEKRFGGLKWWHLWKILSHDIGHDEEAIKILSDISPATRNQVVEHESFRHHLTGLVVFLPGAMMVKRFSERIATFFVKPKKVLLIASPLHNYMLRESGRRAGYFVAPPYGLYRIKSYLESKGIATVEVFDPNLYPEDARARLIEQMTSKSYDIVGFSLTHLNMQDELELIKDVKNISERDGRTSPLLLGGGQEATHNCSQWLEESYLDGVVLGYGEKALEDIIRRFPKRRKGLSKELFDGLPGFAYRNIAGKEKRAPAKPMTPYEFNLITFDNAPTAEIPYQKYWDFNMGVYEPDSLSIRAATLKTIRLYASSHCLNACGFCSSWNFLSAATGGQMPIMYLSAKEMYDLVLQNVKLHNPDAIFFNDDDFIINRANPAIRGRIMEFCGMVKKAKEEGHLPADLKFYMQTKVRNVVLMDSKAHRYVPDREILQTLKEAGFVLIALGVESFSDKLLKSPSIDKKTTEKQSVIAVNGIMGEGIIPLVNILMLTPETTKKDFLHTASVAIGMARKGVQLSVNTFIEFFPGAKLTNQIDLGRYPYFSKRVNGKTGRDLEIPYLLKPRDPEMKMVAEGLADERANIISELNMRPEWRFKYPPQIINGFISFMAAFRLLARSTKDEEEAKYMLARAGEVEEMIFSLIQASKGPQLATTGSHLLSTQFDHLVEKVYHLISNDMMDYEKAVDLINIAGDLKEVRPKTHRRIIDYLSKFLEDIIDSETSFDLYDDSREQMTTIIKYIANGLARIDIASDRTERILALLSFHFGITTPILEDYYVDEENVVSFAPETQVLDNDANIDSEFAKKSVMVFEPHHDDAVAYLGNTLQTRIVPSAARTTLVTVLSDAEGVEDSYAAKYGREHGVKDAEMAEEQLKATKEMIRHEEGAAAAEALGIKNDYMEINGHAFVKNRAFGKKGHFLSYHSIFEKPGRSTEKQLYKNIQACQPDTIILPLPKGSYHQHHRDVARIIISAVISYNKERAAAGKEPVKLYFYADQLDESGFKSYGIEPNMVNLFSEQGEESKQKIFATYGSQINRLKHYGKLITRLDMENAAVAHAKKRHEGMEPGELYAETLLKVKMVPSEFKGKEEAVRVSTDEDSAVNIIMDRLSRMEGGYLRLHVLDGNVFYETPDAFDFLPVTTGKNISGNEGLLKKMNTVSIAIDRSAIGDSWDAVKDRVRKLVDSLTEDDDDQLVTMLQEKASPIRLETVSGDEQLCREKGIAPIAWKDSVREHLKDKERIVVSAHQPGYHRYLGVFHKMSQSDVFIFSDNLQYVTQEWQNRQHFRDIQHKKRWFTVPIVKGRMSDRIMDKMIDNSKQWKEEHWNSIQQAYKGEPCFASYSRFFEELYKRQWNSLNDLNEAMTRYLAKQLGIKNTILLKASQLGDIPGKKSGYIVNMIEEAIGRDIIKKKKVVYLSGIGAMEYLEQDTADGVREQDVIVGRGIDLVFQEYIASKIGGEWKIDPYASATEILFQLGPRAKDLLRIPVEVTSVDASILEFQSAAGQILAKIMDIERKKPDITFENKALLRFYTQTLNLIYKEMEERSRGSMSTIMGQTRTRPIIVDSDKGVNWSELLKALIDAPAGTEVIILGQNANRDRETLQRMAESDPQLNKVVKNIAMLAPPGRIKRESYKYELIGEDGLVNMYVEKKGENLINPAVEGMDKDGVRRSGVVIMAAGAGTRLAALRSLSFEDRAALGLEDINIEDAKTFSKPTVPFTKIMQKSPLQLVAESLAVIARDSGNPDMPVVIVCTQANRNTIIEMLRMNRNFGMESVMLIPDFKGPPVFDAKGRVLKGNQELILSGGGTGGSLRVLGEKGVTVVTRDGKIRSMDPAPIEILDQQYKVKDLYFLQCDMAYSPEVLLAMINAKKRQNKKLVALGYQYPSAEYKLGTILKRHNEDTKATDFEVVEFNERTKDLQNKIEAAEGKQRIPAYAGALGIDIDIVKKIIDDKSLTPYIHWNKTEWLEDGTEVVVNKLQYSLTELFQSTDSLGVIIIPFEEVAPLKDPKKLAFARKTLADRNKRTLKSMGIEVSDQAEVEISALAKIVQIGKGVSVEGEAKVYFGGSGNPDHTISILDNVKFEDKVTVVFDGNGPIIVGENVRFKGPGTIILKSKSDEGIVIPFGVVLKASEGEPTIIRSGEDALAKSNAAVQPAGEKGGKIETQSSGEDKEGNIETQGSSSDKPSHAFRLLSWRSLFGLGGGVDWVPLFTWTTGYLAKHLILNWQDLSWLGITVLSALAFISLLLIITSYIRVKNCINAIRSAHPKFTTWQILTHNIGDDPEAIGNFEPFYSGYYYGGPLRYGTYGQVVHHETFNYKFFNKLGLGFINHIIGLVAFMPGATSLWVEFGKMAKIKELNPPPVVKERYTQMSNIFRKFGVVLSYTVGKELSSDPLRLKNMRLTRKIKFFTDLIDATPAKTGCSFEVSCASLAEAKAVVSSSLYNGNCTYHPKKIGRKLLNLADPNFSQILDDPKCELYEIIKTLKPAQVSVHLGWSAEKIRLGEDNSDLKHDIARSAVIPKEILLERVVANLKALQERLAAKAGYTRTLLVETLDYHDGDAYEYVTDTAFVKEVLRRTGVRLLIDCGHLLISAKNNPAYRDYDYMDYVREMVDKDTIGLIDEIHISIPKYRLLTKYGDDHYSFDYHNESRDEIADILRHIFRLRAENDVNHSLVLNFETNIRYVENEVKALEDEFRQLFEGKKDPAVIVAIIDWDGAIEQGRGITEFLLELKKTGTMIYAMSEKRDEGVLKARIGKYDAAKLIDGICEDPGCDQNTPPEVRKAEKIRKKLRSLKIPASRAVVIGDTPLAMAAAKEAGVVAVGSIRDAKKQGQLRDAGACIVVRNLHKKEEVRKAIEETVAAMAQVPAAKGADPEKVAAEIEREANFNSLMHGAGDYYIVHAKAASEFFLHFRKGMLGFKFFYDNIKTRNVKNHTPDQDEYYKLLEEAFEIYHKLTEREKAALRLAIDLYHVGCRKTARFSYRSEAGAAEAGAILKKYGMTDNALISNVQDIIYEHVTGLDYPWGGFIYAPQNYKAQLFITMLINAAAKRQKTPPYMADNALSTKSLRKLLSTFRMTDTANRRQKTFDVLRPKLKNAGIPQWILESEEGLEFNEDELAYLEKAWTGDYNEEEEWAYLYWNHDNAFANTWADRINNKAYPLFVALRKEGSGLSKVKRFHKLLLLITRLYSIHYNNNMSSTPPKLTIDIIASSEAVGRILTSMERLFSMSPKSITKDAVEKEFYRTSGKSVFGIKIKFEKDRLIFEIPHRKARSEVHRHAFRPVSVGGIDWVAASTIASAFIADYTAKHFAELSTLGAVIFPMLVIISAIFAATSFFRVYHSVYAIHEAHPEFTIWQAIKHDIGHDEKALKVLKETSPFIYEEIIAHEGYRTHFAGLVPFIPGAVRLQQMFAKQVRPSLAGARDSLRSQASLSRNIMEMTSEEITRLTYPDNSEIIKHAKQVAASAGIAARMLGLDEEETEVLRVAVAGHDIGGTLGNKESEHLKDGLFTIARRYGVTVEERDPEAVVAELQSKGSVLRPEHLKLVARMDHAANSIRILEKNNILVPIEIMLLIKYHSNRARAVEEIRASSLTPERKAKVLRVLVCLAVGDIFEFGNNFYKCKNPELLSSRKREFEKPEETMSFIAKDFKEIGVPEEFIGQLQPMLDDPELLRVIERSRMPLKDFAAWEESQGRTAAQETDIFDIPAEDIIAKMNYGFLIPHVRRSNAIALRVGQKLGLSGDVLRLLKYSALLHDLGADVRGIHEGIFFDFSQRLRKAFETPERPKLSIKMASDLLVSRQAGRDGLSSQPEDPALRYALFRKGFVEILGREPNEVEEKVVSSIFDVPLNSIRILKEKNIRVPKDLEVAIRYHNDYKAFSRDLPKFEKELSLSKEDIGLVIAILYLTDNFEHGNNKYTQLKQRRRERVENFKETVDFIDRAFSEAGMDRVPFDAMISILKRGPDAEPDLYSLIAEARQTPELMPEDIVFITAHPQASPANGKESFSRIKVIVFVAVLSALAAILMQASSRLFKKPAADRIQPAVSVLTQEEKFVKDRLERVAGRVAANIEREGLGSLGYNPVILKLLRDIAKDSKVELTDGKSAAVGYLLAVTEELGRLKLLVNRRILDRFTDEDLEPILLHEVAHTSLSHRMGMDRQKELADKFRVFSSHGAIKTDAEAQEICEWIKRYFAVWAQSEYEASTVEFEYHKLAARKLGYKDLKQYFEDRVSRLPEGGLHYRLFADNTAPDGRLNTAMRVSILASMDRDGILGHVALFEGISITNKQQSVKWLVSWLYDPAYYSPALKIEHPAYSRPSTNMWLRVLLLATLPFFTSGCRVADYASAIPLFGWIVIAVVSAVIITKLVQRLFFTAEWHIFGRNADALVRMGASAVPALVEHSKDRLYATDIEERGFVIGVLRRIEDASAAAGLIEMFGEESSFLVYGPIKEALLKKGEKAVPALFEALRNENFNVRSGALSVLKKMGVSDDKVLDALKSADPAFFKDVARALSEYENISPPAAPAFIIGLMQGAYSADTAKSLKDKLDESTDVQIVSGEAELADIARASGVSAIFVDVPSEKLNAGALKGYIGAIKEEAKAQAAAADVRKLLKYGEIIFTMKTVSDETRTKIAALIRKILPEMETVDFDQALKNLLAKGPLSPETIKDINELRALVASRKDEISKAYTALAMPASTEGKKIAMAVTDEVALQYPFFGESVRRARKELGVKSCLIYGGEIRTLYDAQTFAAEAGLDPEDIVFVNKNQAYKDLVAEVANKTGLGPDEMANIGIMSAESEIMFKEGERPGAEKFLEVRKIMVNGVRVVAAMNAYETLLKMVVAADGQLPPGVTQDDAAKGIFKYLPPSLPVDYGKEIETYRNAINLIRSAA